MYARSTFPYLNEQTADEAFNIAWHFVTRTHDVADEFAAQTFIAGEIMHLMERGERHKIRLANRAIAAYERSHPDSIDCLLALGDVTR